MDGVIHRAPGEGTTRLVARGGDYVTARATGSETDGRYTVYEVVGSPGFGPPLHRHDWQEFFYVLDGEVEVQSLDENGDLTSVLGRPGDSFAIAARAAHGFRNPGDQPNRFLVVDQPAGVESLFEAHGVPVAGPGAHPAEEPIDPMQLGELLPSFGIEIVVRGATASG